MQNRYIIFIDIDGTLVEYGGKEINKKVVQEILRLKEDGHIFVISTGRDLDSTLTIKDIDIFNYIAVLFGSCIYKMPQKELVYKANSWTKEEISPFIDYLNLQNHIWTYKDSFCHKTILLDDEYLRTKENVKKIEQSEFRDDLENSNIFQLWVKGHLPEEIETLFPDFNYFRMPHNYTDVTAKNASKSQSIFSLKNLHPDMKTVAIGDSENDLAMFEKSDISICMGNATDDIKQQTTFVTKSLEDDGLIYAFRNILKI